MSNNSTTTYDVVPYRSHPIAASHPARLATIAHLLGISAANVNKSRVLEIGCASGENVLPLAESLPESEFVGVDLSAVQIAHAQKRAEDLQLSNIRFLHSDVREISETLGAFDFVVAHGVYSWVAGDVQQALLAQIRRCLAPRGIAYVSYNTYPGWHMREMIRKMMNYHVRNTVDPEEQIRQARTLLRFLAESVGHQNNAYGILLNNELDTLSRQHDSYLYHEHLEKENHPVYFYEFHDRVTENGLQYLGEADFVSMFVEAFPERVQRTLHSVASTFVEGEQYMDFVRNRTFRQTLLCQDAVKFDRALKSERVRTMFIASPTKPVDPTANLNSTETASFSQGSTTATTSDPLTKAAFMHLGETWPAYLSYSALVESASNRLERKYDDAIDHTPAHDDTQLAEALLSAFANGHVDLSIHPPQIAQSISEKPIASRVSRYQATMQNWATNQMHADIGLHEVDRQILMHLDGQNDIATLTSMLERLQSARLPSATQHAGMSAESLAKQSLSRLAGSAFLLA
jgi:methyltransferase-like protein/SAM-dependent methyltransferase